jgi:hypothetical protein
MALGAAPSDEPAPPVAKPQPKAAVSTLNVAPRSGRALQEATRAALRQWAHVKDAEAKAAAVEFLTLYNELQQDTKLAPKPRQELRQTVRGRLANLALQISKGTAKESKEGQQAKNTPKSVEVPKGQGVLAQWGMGIMQPGGAGMGMGGNGSMTGNEDYGPDLVELIQKTISPPTWDVNGGPGAIYYFRPQRALVVSAPGEVHEQLVDLLEQMERMNR